MPPTTVAGGSYDDVNSMLAGKKDRSPIDLRLAENNVKPPEANPSVPDVPIGPITFLPNSDTPPPIYIGDFPTAGGGVVARYWQNGEFKDYPIEWGDEVVVVAKPEPPSRTTAQPPAVPSGWPIRPSWVPPLNGPSVAPPPTRGPQPPGASLRESRPPPAPPNAGPDYGRKGGYSIAPPPAIPGGVDPGWWQVYQTGLQEAQKASPDWGKVSAGIIAAPIGYLEEYLLRPLVNNVITAGQHLDRGSLWIQQDEWGEAAAEAFTAVAELSLAFLSVATLLEGLGAKAAPALRGSLAREIPASVPRQLGNALPAEAGRRAAINVGDLGSIGAATSRQSFRRQLTSIISQPSHPLHGLLNAEGRLTSSTARGLNELAWFENPSIVEAGHYASARRLTGGADRFVVMSAYENRLLSATLEHPSIGGELLEAGKVLSIGNAPVDFRTAAALVEYGLLDAEVFANAPLVIY